MTAKDTRAAGLLRTQVVLEKLVESRRWLYLHRVLTDAENARVSTRITRWCADKAREYREAQARAARRKA